MYKSIRIVFGDDNAIQAERLGTTDQGQRFKPVIVGKFGMAMSIDPHRVSVNRGLR